MKVFLSTVNQMAFLMLLILIGYVTVKAKIISKDAASMLSELENNIFIPALVLSTFMQNFTSAKMAVAWKYLLCGFVVIATTIPIALILSHVCSKDSYIQNIYKYGLAFSNFGFMGNAVVAALFPSVFMEYLIFVLPFWFFIYVWGVPALLIPNEEEKTSIKSGLKKLINPMFIAMLIGMLTGLLNLHLPSFLISGITVLGDCMSPMAMLLTGMTIAKIDLRATLKNVSIYLVSIIRLILIPLIAIVVLSVLPLPYGLSLCTVCSLAMPLGLNTIVVPSAYGKDTTVAAGMALISHLLSCVTIPFIFTLFDFLHKS